MWTRKEVKEKGIRAFKANYWKTILVAFILSVIGSGYAGGFPKGFPNGNFGGAASSMSSMAEVSGFEGRLPFPSSQEILIFIIVALVIFLLVFALVFGADVLLINPLHVGVRRFFVRNLNHQAEIKEIAHGFDKNYKNVVKTMFFRDLYTILWSLLFIIPGIVKGYEYRMIPYLLAENPDMPKEEAFAESRRMMNGEKWNTFVLDLSFIGWGILSAMTIGILYIFYVGPYKEMTNAALYEVLRYGKSPQISGMDDDGYRTFEDNGRPFV